MELLSHMRVGGGGVEALLSLLEQISLIGGKYALEVKYILSYIEGMSNIHLESTTRKTHFSLIRRSVLCQ